MTTTVKISAHCSDDKRVLIKKEYASGNAGETPITIRDGETYELVVHDDWVVSVREEVEPCIKSEPVAADPDRELTFGEKAVGLTFNPSQDPAVYSCKSEFARVIDRMKDLMNSTDNGDIKRMASIAITEAQTAQMWAVKALTWRA